MKLENWITNLHRSLDGEFRFMKIVDINIHEKEIRCKCSDNKMRYVRLYHYRYENDKYLHFYNYPYEFSIDRNVFKEEEIDFIKNYKKR